MARYVAVMRVAANVITREKMRVSIEAGEVMRVRRRRNEARVSAPSMRITVMRRSQVVSMYTSRRLTSSTQ